MKNLIGVMQGRLSPRYQGRYQAFPADTWENEFTAAQKLGFDCIEYIFDYENFENSPLVTQAGQEKIKALSAQTGVKVLSVCADYFMKYPFFIKDQTLRKVSLDRLKLLIESAARLNIKDITIPCVDESKLQNTEDQSNLISGLLECLPLAKQAGVHLNLETDLAPGEYLRLIKQINHPNIKVNYDIGNSAALGYDPVQELDAYAQHISVLHIKDRLLGGSSVPLGTGVANIPLVINKLKQMNFNGVMIMQAARAAEDEQELALLVQQLQYVRKVLTNLKWI